MQARPLGCSLLPFVRLHPVINPSPQSRRLFDCAEEARDLYMNDGLLLRVSRACWNIDELPHWLGCENKT